MTRTRTLACTAVLLLLAAAAPLAPSVTAQTQPQLPADAPPQPASTPGPSPAAVPHLTGNRNNLFLDAAHGGADDGARIGDRLLEKDLTLSLLGRIRTQLVTEPNLNLILTRDPDAVDPALGSQPPSPPIDTRAGIANHAHPFACLLLHATAAGSGVHIVTSELPPPDPGAATTSAVPWSTAQATWVRQSLRLANQVGISLRQAGVPVYLTHASVRPLDSLTCPAIAVEIAPPHPDPNPSTIADPSYQQRVATAIATALIFWRNHIDPAPVAPAPSTTRPVPATTEAPPAAPPATPTTEPAPVVRRPPPSTVPAPVLRRPPATVPQPDPQRQPSTPPPAGARA